MDNGLLNKTPNGINVMNLFKQKPATVYFSAALALLAAGGALLSFNLRAADELKQSGTNGTNGVAKAALTVTAVQPQSNALGLQVNANGNIAPWQEAIIGAEVNGLKLTDVRVNVGDVVKKGQVLATFSADTARAMRWPQPQPAWPAPRRLSPALEATRRARCQH
jgi:HlyD family secretion protein